MANLAIFPIDIGKWCQKQHSVLHNKNMGGGKGGRRIVKGPQLWGYEGLVVSDAVSPASRMSPLAVGLDRGCSLHCIPGGVGRWRRPGSLLEQWVLVVLTLASLYGSVLTASTQILFHNFSAKIKMSSWCIISRNLDPVYIYNKQPRNKKEEVQSWDFHVPFVHHFQSW